LRHNEEPCLLWGQGPVPPMGGLIKAAPCGCGYLRPVGTGAKANIVADFISFTRSKGAYAGLNLEGAVVAVRDSLNKAYYGKEVRPVDILVRKAVSNPGAKGLLGDLQKATK
jgi:lipid-binding SYLF domain-containing protein